MADEDRGKAREVALAYLASRARSVQEVNRRLRQKGFSEAVTEAVVADLLRLRLLDDRAFARIWVESRMRHRPMGSHRLVQELRGKGVDAASIDEALAEHKAAVDSAEVAAGLLRRQAWRYAGVEEGKARSRMLGFLARRGYDHDTAASAVARVLEELTPP
ncbi:MAG: regulatory protein RecX [Candidatus Latescibacterota bacterium]